ncbi:conserved Plasmodium protein, unknown function [Plasmodium sp. gorilla clade G3]|nr:conserved Plasmodium protein, unknown function [Plasmodium sp. gorilla clade G3]
MLIKQEPKEVEKKEEKEKKGAKDKRKDFFSLNKKREGEKKKKKKKKKTKKDKYIFNKKSDYSCYYLNNECFVKNLSICKKCMFSYFEFKNVTQVIYMRHGARTPKKKIRNIWPFQEGKGDLTFLGFQQSIRVGEYLRKYYYTLSKLNKKYNKRERGLRINNREKCYIKNNKCGVKKCKTIYKNNNNNNNNNYYYYYVINEKYNVSNKKDYVKNIPYDNKGYSYLNDFSISFNELEYRRRNLHKFPYLRVFIKYEKYFLKINKNSKHQRKVFIKIKRRRRNNILKIWIHQHLINKMKKIKNKNMNNYNKCHIKFSSIGKRGYHKMENIECYNNDDKNNDDNNNNNDDKNNDYNNNNNDDNNNNNDDNNNNNDDKNNDYNNNNNDVDNDDNNNNNDVDNNDNNNNYYYYYKDGPPFNNKSFNYADMLKYIKYYYKNILKDKKNIYTNNKKKELLFPLMEDLYMYKKKLLINKMKEKNIKKKKKKYDKIIKLINKYLCIKTTNSERCKLTAYGIICGILGISEYIYFFFFILFFKSNYNKTNHNNIDSYIKKKKKNWLNKRSKCFHHSIFNRFITSGQYNCTDKKDTPVKNYIIGEKICDDIISDDIKCGDTKCGDTKCGDTKCGDTKCGDIKCGDIKCGDIKCGDIKCGDIKCGHIKCGDIKCGDIKYGDIKYGDIKYGDIKYGDIKYGDIKYGDIKYGDIKCGDNNAFHLFKSNKIFCIQSKIKFCDELYIYFNKIFKKLQSLDDIYKINHDFKMFAKDKDVLNNSYKICYDKNKYISYANYNKYWNDYISPSMLKKMKSVKSLQCSNESIISKETQEKEKEKKKKRKIQNSSINNNNLMYNINVFFDLIINEKGNFEFFYKNIKKNRQKNEKGLEEWNAYNIFQIYMKYIFNEFLKFLNKNVLNIENVENIENGENIDNTFNSITNLYNKYYINKVLTRKDDCNINRDNNKKEINKNYNNMIDDNNNNNMIYYNNIDITMSNSHIFKYYYIFNLLNYMEIYMLILFYYLKNTYILFSVVKVAERNSLMLKTLKTKNHYIKKLRNHIIDNSDVYKILSNYYKDEIFIVYDITKWTENCMNTTDILFNDVKKYKKIYDLENMDIPITNDKEEYHVNNSIINVLKKHNSSVYKLKKKLKNSIILKDLKKLNCNFISKNYIHNTNYDQHNKIYHDKIKNWTYHPFHNKKKNVKIIKKFISAYDAYIYHDVNLDLNINRAYEKLSIHRASSTEVIKKDYVKNNYIINGDMNKYEEQNNIIIKGPTINISSEKISCDNKTNFCNTSQDNDREGNILERSEQDRIKRNIHNKEKGKYNTYYTSHELLLPYIIKKNKNSQNRIKLQNGMNIYNNSKNYINNETEYYKKKEKEKEKDDKKDDRKDDRKDDKKDDKKDDRKDDKKDDRKDDKKDDRKDDKKDDKKDDRKNDRKDDRKDNRKDNKKNDKKNDKRNDQKNDKVKKFYKNIYNCYKLMCKIEYSNKYLSWLCSGMSLIDVVINFIINVRLYEKYNKENKTNKCFIPRIILYLTHQSSILSFQSCVGIRKKDMKIPPFASFISLELIHIKKKKIKNLRNKLFNVSNNEKAYCNNNKYIMKGEKIKHTSSHSVNQKDREDVLSFIYHNNTANIFCCKDDCVWKVQKKEYKKKCEKRKKNKKFINEGNENAIKNDGKNRYYILKRNINEDIDKKKCININTCMYNDIPTNVNNKNYENYLPKCLNKIHDFKNLFYLLCYKNNNIQDLIQLYNICLNNNYTHIKNMQLKERKKHGKRNFYGYFVKFTFNNSVPLKLKKNKLIKKYDMGNKKDKEDNHYHNDKNNYSNHIFYDNHHAKNNNNNNNIIHQDINTNKKESLKKKKKKKFIQKYNNFCEQKKSKINNNTSNYISNTVTFFKMKDIAKIKTNKKCDKNNISCINKRREKKNNIFKKLNRNILNFNNSKNDKYMNYIYNSTNVTYGKNYKRINTNINNKFINKKDVNINNILLHTCKQHKKNTSTIILSDNNNNNNNNNTQDDISSKKSKFKDKKRNTKQKYINDHNNNNYNINSYGNNINKDLIDEHKNILHNEYKNINNQIMGYSIKYDENIVSEKSCTNIITSLTDKTKKRRNESKKKLQKKNYENENIVCLDCLISYLKKMLRIYGNPEIL